MEPKHKQDQPLKLSEINKKILEVKKKIQLSEGQRKALFEDCEAERKANADIILKLKKETTQLFVALRESKNPTAKLVAQNKRVQELIGPLDGKTVTEVQELLDLQIIDKSKRLDLIRYRIKQKRKYLAELSQQYQLILSKKERKELTEKVEQPIKKSTCELQNNIHAVEVQIREAVHIRNRYSDVQKTLQNHSAKFGQSIKELEEQLQTQKQNTEKLQNIMNEATKMRSLARGKLLQEEKIAMASASNREKQAAEGRRLVSERKVELERLERKLFQSGKIPIRPEPEGAEIGDQANDDEKSETPPHPVETLTHDFEILKQATGGTSTEEVLEKFRMQKDSQERLKLLRKKSEIEKQNLERQIEKLNRLLDVFKYAEVKEAEKKSGELERLHRSLKEENKRTRLYKEEKAAKEQAIKSIMVSLQALYLSINPMAIPINEPLVILEKINDEIRRILQKYDRLIVVEKHERISPIEISDEKWLPAPYNTLLRRTPLPQAGPVSPAPQPPPGSEDEEEVPSRGYLKRQAQLVVDAKSRRKNIRIHLSKRN